MSALVNERKEGEQEEVYGRLLREERERERENVVIILF